MVKLGDLAPLLKSEINGYLEVLAGGGDVTHEDAPVFLKGITRKSLSPVTIDLRRTQIIQYVSALVKAGYSIESLRSIDDITQGRLITAAMDFFYHRADAKMAVQIQFIAIAVRGLLYHHLSGQLRSKIRRDKEAKIPTANAIVDPRISLLDDIIAQSRPTDRGLRTKNKRCLNQFDDPRNVKALLHLPSQLLKEANKVGLEDGARLAETALAIELLLMCPIRIGNLVGLDLDRHFIKSKPGKKAVIHIVIPRDEVKNDREIEFKLPEHVARMQEKHVEKWRPLRPGSKGTFLFPAGDGGPRSYKLLARTITGIVHRYTGLTVTPHQFRHIAGKLYLEANPNGHEIVRQVLGHASIDTTTKNYTGIDQVKAGKTFDKAVLALRENTKLIASKRSPKK
jgi:integrase